MWKGAFHKKLSSDGNEVFQLCYFNSAPTRAKPRTERSTRTSAARDACMSEYQQGLLRNVQMVAQRTFAHPALEAASLQCIQRIEQRIEECKEAHREGFMIMIYGTSTGSLSIVHAPRRGSGNPPAACGTFRSLPRC
ncbi:hypothetical protein RI054_28g115530 [Pseudoscourfieldia marina]